MTNNKTLKWLCNTAIATMLASTPFLHSCVNAPAGSNPITIDSLTYTSGCEGNEPKRCLNICFEYPTTKGESSRQFCLDVLNDYLRFVEIEDKQCANLDEFKTLLHNYSRSVDSSYIYPDDADIIPEWFIKVKTEVMHSDNRMVTLKYSYSDYRGGAHGSYYYHYLNLDAKTLRPLALTDLVCDVPQLTHIAEQHLIAKAKDLDLQYPDDFMFDNGFALPNEIGAGSNGLVLHYNIYEVAPYALGDIELHINYSELTSILSDKLER